MRTQHFANKKKSEEVPYDVSSNKIVNTENTPKVQNFKDLGYS